MNIGDIVFVVNWKKEYSDIRKWNYETNKWESQFPIKTELPNYSGTQFHWENKYENNLTKKGTINKKEPRKLVEKIPVYKNYKWEIIEIFKHPKAGKLHYDLDKYTQEQLDIWKDYSRYTEENLLLLASTHTDVEVLKCYIVIEESGVSKLTPEQYNNMQFNAMIEFNLGKWDRNQLNSYKDIEKVPSEIKSKFYDEDDKVLFGNSMSRGLVTYNYLDGKFSTDGKPIYLGCDVLYDGKGNSNLPEKEREFIKPHSFIKSYLES